MIIESKPGAGGALAWSQTNTFPGDGYTWMSTNLPHIVLQPLEGQVQYKTDDIQNVCFYHYTPDAIVVRSESPFKTYLNFRNNLYMIVKNYRSGNLFKKLFRRLMLDAIAALRFVAEGKFSHFAAVLKSHYSFYRNLSKFQMKRKAEGPFSLNPNLAGWYNVSIIKLFFIYKKRKFGELDRSYFD